MAGWFSSGNSALDEQISKATSSSLEDIALNLEISDTIRSKTVQPKEAMRSLKKRIGDKNPNVQLATLNLTDTCVKNGGSHFMAEIASREFIDNLLSILNAYGPASTDENVKQKILELIQAWAVAAEGRPALSYISEVYTTLQRDGRRFPPKPDVASSMFDSSAPPEWADSDVCMRCRTPFTFTNRKHHCRNCGNVFCQACSSKSLPLPHLGIMQAVRVDDGCYQKLVDKAAGINRGTPVPKGFDAAKPSRTLYQGYQGSQPKQSSAVDEYDDDLKRALELSLKESQAPAGQGYVPQSQLKAQTARPTVTNGTSSTSKPLPKPTEEEEDPDLKAAIEASIRDMEEQKKRHAASLKQSQSSSAGYTAPVKSREYELTHEEAEKVSLFATLVERLQHQPPGTILREPQIQELYESIGKLRPKLARTYGETMSKHDALLDLHSKLASVVRYYDRMLEDRMNRTYNQGFSGYQLPAPTRQPMMNAYGGMAPISDIDRPGLEGYYNNGPVHQDGYARPPSTLGYPPVAQASQPQYPGYDKRASYMPSQPPTDPSYAPQDPHQYGGQPPNAMYSSPAPYQQQQAPPPQLQRQPSLQQYPPQQTFSPSQPPLQQISPQQQHAQQLHQSPPGIPSDPATAYYSSDPQQAPPYQTVPAPQADPQTYQQQQLPQHQPQQFQQVPPQPYYQTQLPQAQHQVALQNMQATNLQSTPVAPTAAPIYQAAPPQPKVEEALIEL